MASLPLTDYGAIGDGRTAALVSRQGGLDWWCVPRFDAPSVFAALLDEARGGRFDLAAPGCDARIAYAPGTNVLVRDVAGQGGRARVWEFMPWPVPQGAASAVVRAAEGLAGRVAFEARFAPRFDYGRAVPRVEGVPGGAAAREAGMALWLGTDQPLQVADGEAAARFALEQGGRAAFVLAADPHLEARGPPDPAAAWPELERTLAAWRAWDARTLARGPYADAVRRSALAIKLLHHEPTGGIIAAPTTSLPEEPGGVRNWDYRYVWVRDAWLLAEALLLVGHPNQARALLGWLLEASGRSAPGMRIMYGLTPGSMPEEHTLDHLAGWRGSRPVRIGNAAREQFQLDTYGQFVGCLHRCRLMGEDTRAEDWPFIVEVVNLVADRWREPDAGIWEFRAAPRHFVHSKVMAWTALDRALVTAEHLGLDAPLARWRDAREDLREEVLARGWSEARRSFVQSFDGEALDAANLLMPLVGFLPATDPRMVATVERTQAELAEGPFVRRYVANDGLPGREGAFVFCSFWLADNLAMQGRLGDARAILDAILATTGPLGLLAEEVDPRTGELLGNYPQGFSHIGLIRSALLLDEVAASAAAAGALDADGPRRIVGPPFGDRR
ncbi:MAG TPA: glycoside hydrolase family 15 protein [Candidatus Thermoplasmatota archaeon]|jgi:GH15 family glucan-1,4-alpha-glucosidase|nr:glycoside hydrolase family 15 protein [Candidatus Thermoplasmatota archaeon]